VRLWDENNSTASRATVYAICGASNTPSTPNNENCASPTYITNSGGCAGTNWNAPSGGFPALGTTNCSWGVNENPVFYEFTATATTMTLNVNGVRCFGSGCTGLGSSLQFAVFPKFSPCTSTPVGSRLNAVGNSAEDCYIGVGNVGGQFSGLTVGQRYIILLDGLNGARCSWTGISIDNAAPLPTLNTTTATICPGNPATFSINNWQSSYTGVTWTANPADPSLVGQVNNQSITVSPTQTTVYTATINLGSGGNLCSNVPASAYTLTATATISGASAGTGNTVNICPTDPTRNLFNSLGGSPATTGTWTGPSVLGGGHLGTFNPATMNSGSYTYTVTQAGCPSTSAIINVVIPSITTQPTSANICSNGTTTLSSTATGGNYQWQYNNSGTWQNVINGTPSGFTYNNSTTTSLGVSTTNADCTAPAQYRLLVGPAACQLTSNIVNISVLRSSRIAPTGQQCSGTQLNFEACPTGATYSWSVSPPIGTSASPSNGIGQTFSFTPTNTTSSNQTFTVNSTVTLSGLSCPQTFSPIITPRPVQPFTACYQTASFNPTTCSWTLTGTQPTQPPVVNCWDNFVFNNTTCSWNNNGTQPTQPTTACYQTATFNNTTCQWNLTGTQPTQPTTACYQTATFNNTTCQWNLTGTQPAPPTTACYQTATFNNTTCQWNLTGTQPAQPTTACYQTATFNNTTCQWNLTGTQPTQPTTACYQTATFNNTTCQWNLTGTQPAQPTLVYCWDNFVFNNATCTWNNIGTQPSQPQVVNCWDNFIFNSSTCAWVNTGTPQIPLFALTDTFCKGDIIPALPTTSLNGISGNWSPAIDNTTTTNYTFTPSVGQCGSTVNVEIVINQSHDLTLSTTTDSQRVCIGNPILNIVYSFGGGATGVNVVGLPSGLSFNTSGGTTTINGFSAQSGSFQYNITTSGNNCPSKTLSGNISLNSPPLLELGADRKTCCENITLKPNPVIQGLTYTWSNGIIDTIITLSGNTIGTFTVSTQDALGCRNVDSVNVEIYCINAQSGISATPDTVTLGDPSTGSSQITLITAYNSNFQYFWSPENTLNNPTISNPIATPTGPTTYYVTVTDLTNQCVDSAFVFIGVSSPFRYDIPTAFSPNGDNINDLYYPVFASENMTIYLKEFRIYNRWGEVLYDNPTKGWDGKYKGVLQSRDVYVCFVSFEYPNPEKPTEKIRINKQQSFTLLH
jgi:gliding motility-associated-like protein